MSSLEVGSSYVQVIGDRNKAVHKIINVNKGWYTVSNQTKKFRAKELTLKPKTSTRTARLYDVISIPYMSDKIRSFIRIDWSEFVNRIILHHVIPNRRLKIQIIKNTYSKEK